MTPDQILQVLDTAGNRLRYGRFLYPLLRNLRLTNGIELTCYESLSTAYIAGALADLGGGHLYTIHRQVPKAVDYDLRGALVRTKLLRYVELYTSDQSNNAKLLEFITQGLHETFDFCIIDRGISLSEVGFAVCLCERLLMPGGWIIFSDIISPFDTQRDMCPLDNDRSSEPNALVLFRALQTNPYFASFRRFGPFGWAQKTEGIWSAERRRLCEHEAALCDLKLRAQYDPEFRLQLLNDPASALDYLPDYLRAAICKLRFVEFANFFGRDVGEQVCLDTPEWERGISEESLKAMIMSRVLPALDS